MTPELRGRRALVRLLQTVPTSRVAATCGVTVRAVQQWAAGQREPTAANVAALSRFIDW